MDKAAEHEPAAARVSDTRRVFHSLRACPDCGLVQFVPPLVPGQIAECTRCEATLRRGLSDTLGQALVCEFAAAVLFVLALPAALFNLAAAGRFVTADLFTGPDRLTSLGMGELAGLVVVVLVLMPAVKMGLMLTVLLGLHARRPPKLLPFLFSWIPAIGPWAMVEVFLLGAFVAYTRLQAIATVEVGPALIALGGVMLTMVAADAILDEDTVWERMTERGLSPRLAQSPYDVDAAEENEAREAVAETVGRTHARDQVRGAGSTEWPDVAGSSGIIACDCCRLVLQGEPGESCPRCGARLRHRKQDSIVRTWSLLLSAALLYIPANFLPVMTVIRFGRGAPNTILSGVEELAEAHMWPLAVLVFLASITVPLLKLLGLSLMLIGTHFGSPIRLRDRTRLYRLIDVIGRWSMIDVFMLTILVGLVQMGFIANVLPGAGAVSFAAVVVLTMFASASFDPRLMWDAAEAAGADLDTEKAAPRPRRRKTSAGVTA